MPSVYGQVGLGPGPIPPDILGGTLSPGPVLLCADPTVAFPLVLQPLVVVPTLLQTPLPHPPGRSVASLVYSRAHDIITTS